MERDPEFVCSYGKFKMLVRTSEVVLQVNAFTTKPGDLSLSPRIHMMDGEPTPVNYPLTWTCVPPQFIPTHKQINECKYSYIYEYIS